MKNTTRILFDASPLLNSSLSGVGYYTKYIVEILASNEAYELTGFYFNFLGRKKVNLKSKYPNVTFIEIKHFPGIILGPLARLVGLQPPIELFLNNKYDLHFYPNFTSYPSIHKTPQIVVVHDFCFIEHPEYVSPKNQKYLFKLTRRAISRSVTVICVSEFTKRRLEDIYGKNNSVVLPPPIRKIDADQNKTRRKFTENKYILFVSTLEPRKNIESLVAAYQSSGINKLYDLVLAGGNGWNDEGIVTCIEKAQKAGFNVIKTGYISEDERDDLYKNASLFVMPSHYEGFGMPILEAMQYNIPIAVSDIPVFHEVAGDSVVYFDKDNPNDITNVIEDYLCDEKKKKALITTYEDCLSKYSWENNAKIVFNAFEKLVKKVGVDMSEALQENTDKQSVISNIENVIENHGFKIAETNFDKPWGAYFRLENTDAEKFIDTYFADIKDQFDTFEGLSPKFLLVAPGERLSWQYHFNRAEHWRVLEGTVGVKLADDDTEPENYIEKSEGELVQFPALKRHRLIGLGDWGVVVEIWQHVNPEQASDESDIVRVADDYAR